MKKLFFVMSLVGLLGSIEHTFADQYACERNGLSRGDYRRGSAVDEDIDDIDARDARSHRRGSRR